MIFDFFLHCLSLIQYLNNSQCTIVIRKRSNFEIIISGEQCMIFFLILPIYLDAMVCFVLMNAAIDLKISDNIFFCLLFAAYKAYKYNLSSVNVGMFF